MGVTAGISTVTSDEANMMLVYPNPTSGLSSIQVTNAEVSRIELKVLNVLGEEMAIVVSEQAQAGTHRYSFDTSSLSTGLYYYNLTIGNKKYVQKLMVTR